MNDYCKSNIRISGLIRKYQVSAPTVYKIIHRARYKDYAIIFGKLCQEDKIEQRFTKVKCPQTNGKAERVIRTIMDMWHSKHIFKNRNHRKIELIRFVNYYNNVKPHKGINNMTPMEKLLEYFYPDEI